MKAHETATIRMLLELAIVQGLAISLYDGGEWTVKKSTDVAEILAACGTTDVDTLRFRVRDDLELDEKERGKIVGAVLLVYGNGPGELVADFSDNPEIRRFMDPVMARGEAISRDLAIADLMNEIANVRAAVHTSGNNVGLAEANSCLADDMERHLESLIAKAVQS